MSYFEIEIQTDNEGREAKGIYSYDNKVDAEIVFHQKVASGMTAIKNGSLKSALNIVMNGMGGVELSDYKEKAEEIEEA